MAEESAISWTDATFNPWMGCARVSPACENCYAETLVTTRMRLPVWGPPKTTARKRTAAANWAKPRAWDRAAAKAGRRTKVFCASLADVFEDHPALPEWRADLFELIEATPHLDWLLLTKRPQHMARFAPKRWADGWPANVWAGCTVEDQRRADERVPHLLRVPAAVRFLSCEPLLGPVDLRGMLPGIDWIIAGGESGAAARPMHPDWAFDLLTQARRVGAAFHFKQWGEWRPRVPSDPDDQRHVRLTDLGENSQTGGAGGNDVWMQRAGKHAAGRELDGRVWDEFPCAAAEGGEGR
jgi:protein gp37